MKGIEKTISFTMAHPDSRYAGFVMRKVTSQLAGVTVTLSETTTGMDYEEFTKANPKIPVDGRSARNLQEDIMRMSDEDLSALGLTRAEGVQRMEEYVREEEDLTPTYNYPVHEGFGVWRFSDDTRKKCPKKDALAHQKELDSKKDA